MDKLIKKAIEAVKNDTLGALTEDEFRHISTNQLFIETLRQKEIVFQKRLSASSEGSRIIFWQVKQMRLADESLIQRYFLRNVKNPLNLTDSECFYLDPKGSPDIMRNLHQFCWR